jgi:peptidoglycan hydrolase CwlO-like protein
MTTCPLFSTAKTLVLSIIFILLLQTSSIAVRAANCDDIKCNKDNQDENAYLSCIGEKRSCLESKINEAQSQKITLTNTISIISGKINLQELKINQTETEIEKLEKQIDELTDRINGLDLSLDRLTGMLVERIRGSI